MQIINSDQISEGGEADGDPEPDRSDGGFGEGECGGDASQGERLCGPGGQHYGREGGRCCERGIAHGPGAGADRGYREEKDGDREGADGIVITLLDAEE